MPYLYSAVTLLLFLLLHFFVFVFNYLLWDRKLFQPCVLFSLVWFAVLVMHFIFKQTVLDELPLISLRLHLIFFGGVLAFSAGGSIIYFQSNYKTASAPLDKTANTEVNQAIRIGLLLIILVGLPFYIRASYQVFIQSNAEEFLKGLRSELTSGDADIGPAKYLMSLAFVAFAFNLYGYLKDKTNRNLVLFVSTLLALIVYVIFATGRTYFLVILSIYIGIAFFTISGFSIKKLFAALMFFLLLFMSIGVIYGKGGSVFFSLKENVTASIENVGIYMVTPMNALDTELGDNSSERADGDNTLRFFKKLGMSAGILPQRKVADLIQMYAFVPYATNVYTFYSPYIRDFGVGYALLMLFLFGWIHSWVFFKALKAASLRYILYFSFLLFPLLISFFSDHYLGSLSLWLQVIFFIETVLFFNKFLSTSQSGKLPI